MCGGRGCGIRTCGSKMCGSTLPSPLASTPKQSKRIQLLSPQCWNTYVYIYIYMKRYMYICKMNRNIWTNAWLHSLTFILVFCVYVRSACAVRHSCSGESVPPCFLTLNGQSCMQARCHTSHQLCSTYTQEHSTTKFCSNLKVSMRGITNLDMIVDNATYIPHIALLS